MSFRCRRSQAFIRASKIEDRRFGSAQFAAQTAALHFSMGMGDGGERERERADFGICDSSVSVSGMEYGVWVMGFGLGFLGIGIRSQEFCVSGRARRAFRNIHFFFINGPRNGRQTRRVGIYSFMAPPFRS